MTPSPFDLTGPLPAPGVTVLEASAGTGKTYTIAGLAARFVADGYPLDGLLLVTFTVMATGELRERVRERLVAVERALRTGVPGDDPVAVCLLDGPAEEVERRRRRLERALAGFDAATIATTHGFCQEMLSGLGVDGDLEPDHVFVEDVSDLVREVVDDLYVRRFHRHGDPPFTRREAGTIVATAAVENPVAPLEPAGAPEASVPAMRWRLAEAARRELDARKRRLTLLTYDDQLTRLDAALDRPAAVARLRQRFAVVLVDEFQDTDPVQWSVLEKAFGAGGTRLVLIGDPKQAIYAFRGADVYAYLRAARRADAEHTLAVNWRADAGLIAAYDALFANARLGDAGIVYRQVEAAPPNRAPRYAGAPDPAPLRVRLVDRHRSGTTAKGWASKPGAQALIADDLAADVVGLLDAGATIEGRAVAPADVAVLVRSHFEADDVRAALAAAGVPAVIAGAGSVFDTPAAGHWLRLLDALERPADARRAHAVALTPFLGWTAETVAGASEERWEAEVYAKLHAWARVLRLRGVASLLEALTLSERLPGRVLATADGERALTDLRHVGQLLHAAATGEQLGPTALAGWLRRRVDEAGRDGGDEERARRLESDAAAVQVLTIHRSKGLEFPVVYYPYLWGSRRPQKGRPVVYHEGDVRTLDVGLEGPAYDAHFAKWLEEERGEDLRLLYVALTRAKHQAVVWWAGSFDAGNSALGRLVFARGEDGEIPSAGAGTPSDGFARERFRALAAAARGCVSVAAADPVPGRFWPGAPEPDAALDAAAFARTLDWSWRRTSYSAITAGAHDAHVASEPEDPLLADEPGDVAVDAPAPQDPVPLAAMPVGVRVGTAVHRALEVVDFAAPDPEAALRDALPGDLAEAAGGLAIALRTPLNGGPDPLTLAGVARADRLDELAFELPLAGGDAPAGSLTLAALAGVLRTHGEPVPGYADRLADPALAGELRGYLTGSIDLVVRHGGRFTVVDYKTNWLGAEPTDYAPDRLAAEMDGYHYALQALLYAAALHRYLRWRLAGYDPDRHLGGVRYLFLRGMTGAPGAGVFAWDPPAALVVALSDALDGAT